MRWEKSAWRKYGGVCGIVEKMAHYGNSNAGLAFTVAIRSLDGQYENKNNSCVFLAQTADHGKP